MESYALEIDPGQLVRWIQAERGTGPASFRISARRSEEVREIPAQMETQFGDAEREDLGETATVATLEISPASSSDGWRLSITVEDEIGPRLVDEEAADGAEQEIDLETFCEEFIWNERGSVSVVAEVQDAGARGRLARLLHAVERDDHAHPGSAGAVA